jgi:hypothetical protein
MAEQLQESTIFSSGAKPKSRVFQSLFSKRLSSVFGYQTVTNKTAQSEFEKSTGIRFVKVDVGNQAYRVKQAALGSVFKSAPLSTTLEKYFNAWLTETTLSYSDIKERQDRLGELAFAVYNDPFLSRVCKLVADEATQLDVQNRLITVESNSAAFVNKCYELFAQWGITQTRTHAVCYDLERYGEGLWAHRVTERGVERIIPLRVPQLQERLEFNPARMAEYLGQITGNMDMNKNRRSKLQSLIDLLNKNQDVETYGPHEHTVEDLTENFADTFDTKLLGFEFADGLIVPPWLVTHFRYDADTTEFFPYGTPPLLMALAPFQQAHATMALQGLARQMSFPVQVYKVKQTEGVGPATAFDTVNTVREEYDNIGVTPASNSLEVYTINTKIWIPEGLLDFQVVESKTDIDFTGDLELYMDRVAIASGVPKAYLDQEFGGFGNSGIALTEQYKPFARHVYTVQSAFLEGLGQLIRLHFAITNEFDYNTPFILSMRFPAEEMGDEKREARTASIDLANGIVELLQGVLGLEEGEPLPEDVVSDILAKYTFLDPTDLQRWIRLSTIQKAAANSAAAAAEEGEEGSEFGTGEGDADEVGDMVEDTSPGAEAGAGPEGSELPESMSKSQREYYLKTRQRLIEKKIKLREEQIRKRYREARNEVMMHFFESNGFSEWQDPVRGHAIMIPKVLTNHPLFESFSIVKSEVSAPKSNALRETKTITDMMAEAKHDNDMKSVIDEGIQSTIRESIEDINFAETDGILAK